MQLMVGCLSIKRSFNSALKFYANKIQGYFHVIIFLFGGKPTRIHFSLKISQMLNLRLDQRQIISSNSKTSYYLSK